MSCPPATCFPSVPVSDIGLASGLYHCWTSCHWWLSSAPIYLDPFTRPLTHPIPYPQRKSTAPPQLLSSTQMSRMHPSLAKIWNRIGPRTEPYKLPSVMGHQPRIPSFAAILWALLLSHFITQHCVVLFILQVHNLSRRILWGMVSLSKSRKNTPTTYHSSTLSWKEIKLLRSDFTLWTHIDW